MGGRLGDGMTRWLARAVRAPAYYITWFEAYGSYRDMVRFDPPVPMLFLYGKRKPFLAVDAWLTEPSSPPPATR